MIAARIFTPCLILFPVTPELKLVFETHKSVIFNKDKTKFVEYMNLNCAWGFWCDVDIPFLHIFDESSPFLYIPFLSLVMGVLVQSLPYYILRGVSLLVFGQ